jgi:hypothetical protein
MKKYLEEKIKALRIEIEANRAISNYQDAFKNQVRLYLIIGVVNENEHLGNVSKLYLVQAVIADKVIEDKVFEAKKEAVSEIGALKNIYGNSAQVHIFIG